LLFGAREGEHVSVYRIGVEEWSDKRNWPDTAEREPNWTPDFRE
jgi:hypothetical protein